MRVEPLLDKELGDSQKLNFGQCLIAEPGFRGTKGQSKGPSKGDLNPSWIFTVSHYYFTDYSFKLHVDCMGRLLWRRYVWVRYVYTVHKFVKKSLTICLTILIGEQLCSELVVVVVVRP